MSVFTDGKTDTRYLLVVNKNVNGSVLGTIQLKSAKSISVFNKATKSANSIGTGSSISINLFAGGGEVFILK